MIQTEQRFERACEQIILLNDRMNIVKRRYFDAKRRENRALRKSLHLQLAVLEGVRNMYFEYARRKAEEVVELRRELFDENVTDE